MATQDLGAALRDPNWNAVLEQGDHGGDLPPAIIVDIDETILNNAGHAARAIIARKGFVQEIWRAWVRETVAPAVPGAVDYLRRGRSHGNYGLLYVQPISRPRRGDPQEPGSRRLSAPERHRRGPAPRREAGLGNRQVTAPGLGCRELSGSCRSSGTTCATFVHVPEDDDDAARIEIALSHRDRWGEGWYMLPNPIYGGWEQALMKGRVRGARVAAGTQSSSASGPIETPEVVEAKRQLADTGWTLIASRASSFCPTSLQSLTFSMLASVASLAISRALLLHPRPQGAVPRVARLSPS